MPLKDKIREVKTQTRRPDRDFRPMDVAAYQQIALPHDPRRWPDPEGYRLELTVATTFYANGTQFREARYAAEQCLLHMLYEDLLMRLAHIERAVFAHDAKGVLDAVVAIKKDVLGLE